MKDSSALQQHLLGAAAKALGTDLEKLVHKTAIRKADPSGVYTDYDLTLGQFYVPGRTQRENAADEHKMLAGLKVMAQKLQKQNEALKLKIKSDSDAAFLKGIAEGQSKGIQQGYQKGKAESKTEVATLQASVTKILKQFELKQAELLHKSEGKILELAMACAETVINGEIKQNPDAVLGVIRAAIAEIAKADAVVIKVNPTDTECVEAGRSFWLPVSSTLKAVKVEADTRVPKGGCIVDCSAGRVDGRLSTQLESVREHFFRLWEEKSPRTLPS